VRWHCVKLTAADISRGRHSTILAQFETYFIGVGSPPEMAMFSTDFSGASACLYFSPATTLCAQRFVTLFTLRFATRRANLWSYSPVTGTLLAKCHQLQQRAKCRDGKASVCAAPLEMWAAVTDTHGLHWYPVQSAQHNSAGGATRPIPGQPPWLQPG
jgi:hypothetical protein